MKLIDLLSVIDENAALFVVESGTGHIIDCYDGKNSISTTFNQSKVVSLYAVENIVYASILW